MLLLQTLVDSLANVIVLVVIPFLVYFCYHQIQNWRIRRKSSSHSDQKSVGLPQLVQRLGMQLGEPRYLGFAAVIAVCSVLVLVFLFPVSTETSTRQGSAFRSFDGLGFTLQAVVLALVYGVVKTGFCEEFLFRGLIAGALARRMSFTRANIAQSLVFLLPHFLILGFAPELWWLLPVIFSLSLILGWLRIKSGSILGPWLVHASSNVAMALIVATKSAVS